MGRARAVETCPSVLAQSVWSKGEKRDGTGGKRVPPPARLGGSPPPLRVAGTPSAARVMWLARSEFPFEVVTSKEVLLFATCSLLRSPDGLLSDLFQSS